MKHRYKYSVAELRSVFMLVFTARRYRALC